MQAASRIVAWHLYEARRFLSELAASPSVSNAAKLDVWLIQHCRERHISRVSTHEVLQLGPNPLRKRAVLGDALDELAEVGRARLIVDGKRKEIEINPVLLELH
jgi:putative DNA primase/helicase